MALIVVLSVFLWWLPGVIYCSRHPDRPLRVAAVHSSAHFVAVALLTAGVIFDRGPGGSAYSTLEELFFFFDIYEFPLAQLWLWFADEPFLHMDHPYRTWRACVNPMLQGGLGSIYHFGLAYVLCRWYHRSKKAAAIQAEDAQAMAQSEDDTGTGPS